MNKWTIAKYIIGVALVLIFISGVRHWYNSYHSASATQSASAGRAAAAAYQPPRMIAGKCTGMEKVEVIPKHEIPVNDDVSCILHFGFVNGTIELNGPTGSLVLHPGEKAPRSYMTMTARALSGNPVMSHTSCDSLQERRYDGTNCV